MQVCFYIDENTGVVYHIKYKIVIAITFRMVLHEHKYQKETEVY